MDLVIVLGGGVSSTFPNEPTTWAKERVARAVQLYGKSECKFLLTSRGTTHKKSPIAANGLAVDESVAMARFMVDEFAIDPGRVLMDTWSMDTIGNAFFALQCHVLPTSFEKIAVISSQFHIRRVQEIFETLIRVVNTSAPVSRSVRACYHACADTGLTQKELLSRTRKEAADLDKFKRNASMLGLDARKWHEFVFQRHAAYAFRNHYSNSAKPAPSDSDCGY